MKAFYTYVCFYIIKNTKALTDIRKLILIFHRVSVPGLGTLRFVGWVAPAHGKSVLNVQFKSLPVLKFDFRLLILSFNLLAVSLFLLMARSDGL